MQAVVLTCHARQLLVPEAAVRKLPLVGSLVNLTPDCAAHPVPAEVMVLLDAVGLAYAAAEPEDFVLPCEASRLQLQMLMVPAEELARLRTARQLTSAIAQLTEQLAAERQAHAAAVARLERVVSRVREATEPSGSPQHQAADDAQGSLQPHAESRDGSPQPEPSGSQHAGGTSGDGSLLLLADAAALAGTKRGALADGRPAKKAKRTRTLNHLIAEVLPDGAPLTMRNGDDHVECTARRCVRHGQTALQVECACCNEVFAPSTSMAHIGVVSLQPFHHLWHDGKTLNQLAFEHFGTGRPRGCSKCKFNPWGCSSCPTDKARALAQAAVAAHWRTTHLREADLPEDRVAIATFVNEELLHRGYYSPSAERAYILGHHRDPANKQWVPCQVCDAPCYAQCSSLQQFDASGNKKWQQAVRLVDAAWRPLLEGPRKLAWLHPRANGKGVWEEAAPAPTPAAAAAPATGAERIAVFLNRVFLHEGLYDPTLDLVWRTQADGSHRQVASLSKFDTTGGRKWKDKVWLVAAGEERTMLLKLSERYPDATGMGLAPAPAPS